MTYAVLDSKKNGNSVTAIINSEFVDFRFVEVRKRIEPIDQPIK